MSEKKTNRPPEGTPEFKEWLKQQAAKDINDIFGDNHQPVDFEKGGAIFGNIDNLDKTDAELFPDEFEEYTPEERRKNFKVHPTENEEDEK